MKYLNDSRPWETAGEVPGSAGYCCDRDRGCGGLFRRRGWIAERQHVVGWRWAL